eukprot:CAMPEP_0170748162 /NCGR_PEP_ID=MMETSP0437-20130122/9704_1 /TAXON_ID=0 /ORGANISM="Sexangularia sp." /LENGTH=112 /DNA_ID=CAMNT_0011086979 /DNA_START=123 /DNA_END=461 /DNA_ORIENTATION=-
MMQEFIKLMVFATESAASTTGSPFVLYHSRGSEIDAEFCLPVSATVEVKDGVACRVVPAFPAKYEKVVGGYERLPGVHEELGNTCPAVEVFEKGPKETKDDSEWVTHVYVAA